ncbi:hypothetical protein E4U41_002711 [Claviceps citrina]|nr:hypothetical protein E4U41_002711 [Claviceps citrina]
MLGSLLGGLDARNLSHIVNVVVVSDHGMATTDTARLLQLEDLVDTSSIEHTDGWPLYGLRPRHESDTPALYARLKDKAAANPSFDVYLRDRDMPPRYHFSRSNRIAPLWLVPKTGWAIVRKQELVVEEALRAGQVYHPRGLHGYDHEHPLMRAIFVARGPAFPHPANSMVEPFQNINVYNILCDTLGITPQPNNGTLRLPLTPIGSHTTENQQPPPADPPLLPTTTTTTTTITTTSSSSSSVPPPPPSTPSNTAQSARPHPVALSDTSTQPPRPHPIPPPQTTHADDAPPRPVKATSPGGAATATSVSHVDGKGGGGGGGGGHDDGDGASLLGAKVQGWWDWLTDQVGEVWDAVTGSG